ncbi:DUF4870 domain-containing protein [Dendrosporobacter sp. 1207_IL3150]|uniref:DUF4870 domain-containing protein n=1 Tax=Dendrosporobacter sp. 1207_IL3150 TaxID=3084054 RepID=UPI002FD9465E
MGKSSTGMEENVAGFLCYLGGIITGIIFYLMEKESTFVKFHALQSIITFSIIFVINIILSIIPILGWAISFIFSLAAIIVWIVCMIKAYQGNSFKLPVIGELVEKQVLNK